MLVSALKYIVLVVLITYTSSFHNRFGFHNNLKLNRMKLFAEISTKLDVNALPDSKRRLEEVSGKIQSNLSKDVMDVGYLRESVRDMELESSQPGFWDDQEKAQSLLTEMNRVKALVDRVDGWKRNCEDIEALIEMAIDDEAGSLELLVEAKSLLDCVEKDLDAFEVERLLSGKYDKYGCTLCIQSGAGGTEAQDWAGMLLRMYKRFAERRGFKLTIVEEMPADFGIKSVEIKIEGLCIF